MIYDCLSMANKEVEGMAKYSNTVEYNIRTTLDQSGLTQLHSQIQLVENELKTLQQQKLISKKSKEAFSRPETYKKLKESHKIAMNRPEVIKRARESHLGKKLLPETIKKLSEINIGKNTWSKGRTYYTNGKMNVCAFECPEGFHKGRTWKKDMK